MKKDTDELHQEYDLRTMPHLMSGPEYLRHRRKKQDMQRRVVILDSDVAPYFADDAAVNEALRWYLSQTKTENNPRDFNSR
jgi:hypothetical protein